MSIALQSNRIKLIILIAITFTIIVFSLIRGYFDNIERFNAESIIIQKSIRDEDRIELTNHEDINNFFMELAMENWYRVYAFDLKCAPEYTIILDEKKKIEVLCFKNNVSYCKVGKKYYATDQNILDLVSDVYFNHNNQ